MAELDSVSTLPLPSTDDLLAAAASLLAAASCSSLVTLSQLAALLRPLPSALSAVPPSPELLRDLLRVRDAALRAAAAPTPSSARLVEAAASSLCRSLGAGILSWEEIGEEEGRRAAESLYRAMVSAKLEIPPERPSRSSGGATAVLDWQEVVARLKAGEEGALEELAELVEEGVASAERGRAAVALLVARLGSSGVGEGKLEDGRRARILGLLRKLVLQSDEHKETVAELGTLSAILQSLTNEIDEVREAIGILLSVADVPKFRQRIGRVPGCVKMLVSALHADDGCTSNDARKLLHSLSGNIQNVLLMAESGYFEFVFPYLKEGSDMNKILVASAISKMDLSDKMKADLGAGSIAPLVEMLTSGKLEAKLSSLGALRKLSTLSQNVPLLIHSGIVAPLFQLLFSVTSVLVTLREPAAAILACIAQSELILVHKDAAQQMLSLLSLSNPSIQHHLLQALNCVASYQLSSKIRAKMKKSGAIQLILPFITSNNDEIRLDALKLLYTISMDPLTDFAGKVGETNITVLVNIISTAESVEERATAVGILSNIPVNDKKTTEMLSGTNLLPVLASLLSAHITNPPEVSGERLLETILALLTRFTAPSDKKLQRVCAELGIIPLLVKLLSWGSSLMWARAANSLAQLSQNSLSLAKSKTTRWMCVPTSTETFCKVHNYRCSVRSTFCLVKAGAVPPLVQILAGNEREADEAVLSALATLLQDESLEGGSAVLDKASGVEAILRVTQTGSSKTKEKAVWMLERVLRSNTYRQKYGDAVVHLLADLQGGGDLTLPFMTAKVVVNLNTSGNSDAPHEP